MERTLTAQLPSHEPDETRIAANEIDLEDIALTEEASKALFEQLKAAGIEPSQAFMETRARWTEAGELLLYYTLQQKTDDTQAQTIVMQIPADHWGVDIQQTYLH